MFEGDEAAVSSMVEWCRRGPRGAGVEDMEVTWGEPDGAGPHFDVR